MIPQNCCELWGLAERVGDPVSQLTAISEPAQARGGFYYGWANMVVAAAAMVATLPGRTFGLGMITEPLLRDLNVSHFDFCRVQRLGNADWLELLSCLRPAHRPAWCSLWC